MIVEVNQRALTVFIVISGITVGLLFLALLPVVIFSIGSNDSGLEIFGTIVGNASLLPANILAIRYRKSAGIWLLLVAILLGTSSLYNEIYIVRLHHAVVETKNLVFSSLWSAAIPGLLGTFYLVTEKLGWEKFSRGTSLNSEPNK